MSTATDIDVAALVGEMDAVPCEHSQHTVTKLFHDDGPATHYIRAIHPCQPPSHAFAACQKMVNTIRAALTVICGSCGAITTANEAHEILGPVNA
ncbi:hypothetical protein ACFFGR_09475 [Arthrobacter liuii]|uniref:Uncharacterized protein n=1 Tax=Arthrobacter liuii TaxID=1476996 RepID=A0ABQ2ARC3_9MICC|nr:hypothetical protein [Arthrobacter liuii]GGH93931.1 hypothetical protein GCM10007170_15950 [Arthrobacter liuii]